MKTPTILLIPQLKQCSKCSEIKTLNLYELRRDTNNYRSWCKKCQAFKQKARRIKKYGISTPLTEAQRKENGGEQAVSAVARTRCAEFFDS